MLLLLEQREKKECFGATTQRKFIVACQKLNPIYFIKLRVFGWILGICWLVFPPKTKNYLSYGAKFEFVSFLSSMPRIAGATIWRAYTSSNT